MAASDKSYRKGRGKHQAATSVSKLLLMCWLSLGHLTMACLFAGITPRRSVSPALPLPPPARRLAESFFTKKDRGSVSRTRSQ